MKHLGDITLIRGDEIEPVNCIIGGSPCQDLSVAGKRAGLSGERSGLFMEQIRIVKEMRKKYGKPRYMVWENVPGAFSSNRGEDFRVVLEEIVKVVDESAVIPRPPKDKWTYAGCVMGGTTTLDTRSPGELTTLNFGECPSVAVESHLSQILEENPLPKYSLSEKACAGILRRAENRGKELPEVLKTALIRRSGACKATGSVAPIRQDAMGADGART